jgi:hypothetical protein
MPFSLDGIVHTWRCSRCDAKIPGSKRPTDTQQKELYDHMQGIALEAPADQVDRYSSAAGSFRIPYWDWAQGKAGGGVPDFFVQPSITVKTPSGDEREIQNPLYDYKFKPLIEGDFTGKVCNLGGFLDIIDRSCSGLKLTALFDGRQPIIRGRSHGTISLNLASSSCSARIKMEWRVLFEEAP